MYSSSHIIDCPSTHAGVRQGCRELRGYLATCGLDDQQLAEWELVAIEAGNNAVQYSERHGHAAEPIRMIVNTGEESVEVAVTDHSSNFDWPADVALPPDDSEHGRGLFLISELTDSVRYLRGHEENFLLMEKRRPKISTELDVQRDDSLEHTMHLMTEELVNSYETLSAIFRFSSEISLVDNVNLYAEKWIGELMKVTGGTWYVLRQLDAQKGTLNLISSFGGRSSCPPKLPLRGKGQEFRCVECAAVLRRADILFDGGTPQQLLTGLKRTFGLPLSGLCHPIYIGQDLFGVLTLGTHSPNSTFTVSQINLVHTFADLLSVQINNLQNYQIALQAREVTRELQVAAGIQRSLLPQDIPQPKGFQIAAQSINARQVGGDFYDVIPCPGGGVLLAIADVMGKGVPAAMFAAIFRSHLRARPDLLTAPGKLMMWLNRVLFSDLDHVDMFVTAQLAYLDPKAHKLVLSSAGHCPALLTGKDMDTVLSLSGEGPPLGITPGATYEAQCYDLPVSSRLLMYTDGLAEMRNHEQKTLGDDAVKEWLLKSAEQDSPASASCATLLQLAASHCDIHHLRDDITYLMLTESSNSSQAAIINSFML